VVKRLLGAVQDLNIPHERSSAGNTVSVSVGVACGQPSSAGIAADLLASADVQLYAAKRQGRARYSAVMHKTV
jgi:diguanylate cyclase (GGDEF)-like protein